MDALLLIARLLVAAAFALAGLGKLVDPQGSRRSLTGLGLSRSLAVPLGIILPFVDVLTAILLVPVGTARWGALVSLVLLLVFTILITARLGRGQRPEGYYYGHIGSTAASADTVARHLILAVLGAVVLARGSGNSAVAWLSDLDTGERLAVAIAAVALALVMITGWLVVELVQQVGRLLLRLEGTEPPPMRSAGLSSQTAPAASARSPSQPVAASSPAPSPEARPRSAGLPLRTPAPDFQLPDLDGTAVTLAGLIAERKPILLIFGDQSSRFSHALMPEIGSWQRENADKVATILVTKGDIEFHRALKAEHGLQRVLLQRDHEVARAYQVSGIPSAVLIRPDGLIGSSTASGGNQIRALATQTLTTLAGMPAAAPFASPTSNEQIGAPVPVRGQIAPDVRLPDLSGETVDLKDFPGEPVMLLFWNPDCRFCQRMLPDFQAWAAIAGEKAPRVLVISTGTPEANTAIGFRSAVLLDDRLSVARSFHAAGTPSAVLIDEAGRIASDVAVGASSVLALARRSEAVTASAPASAPA